MFTDMGCISIWQPVDESFQSKSVYYVHDSFHVRIKITKGNIFYHGAPLHDGAAVIRDGRVVAAGCVLPLTQKENLDTQLGTRHRAAIGMSEQGDAMIVVTSEETGTISIACKGQLIRNLTDSDLREHLVRYLCGTNNEDKAAVKGIRKLFGGFKK